MDPKSALFWRVKILRIHCKKQGLGGGSTHLKTRPKSSFYFFCNKNCFFTTQRFASTGSSFFRFKDLFLHHFRGVFGDLFSGRDFGMKREYAQFQLQKTEFSVGYTCYAMLKKLDFSLKNVLNNERYDNRHFQDLFLKSSPLPHRSSILGGFLHEKSKKKRNFFVLFQNVVFHDFASSFLVNF